MWSDPNGFGISTVHNETPCLRLPVMIGVSWFGRNRRKVCFLNTAVQPRSQKGANPNRLAARSLSLNMYAVGCSPASRSVPLPIAINSVLFAAFRAAYGCWLGWVNSTLWRIWASELLTRMCDAPESGTARSCVLRRETATGCSAKFALARFGFRMQC